MSNLSNLSHLLYLRQNLLKLCQYIAASSFLPTLGWKRQGIAEFLVDKKTGENKTCILVGTVVDDRLLCGPAGNHTSKGKFPRKLTDARFTFILGKPEYPELHNDFDVACKACPKIQGNIASTDDHRYWKELVGKDEVFKFCAPVFEPRVCQRFRWKDSADL